MSEKSESRPLIVKILAIVGFSATILLIGWAILMLILRSPSIFSSLAERKENLEQETKEQTFVLSSETNEVRSGEALTITWTALPDDGAYNFTYACIPDVKLTVKNAQGAVIDLPCDTEFTIPKDVQELSVTATSRTDEVDLPLTVAFINDEKEELAKADHTITVRTTTVAQNAPQQSAPRTSGTVAPNPSTQPAAPRAAYIVPVITYPTSNPNGYSDLKVVTLGTGVIERGVFRFTNEYDKDEDNAVMINVENIGTKTSDYWRLRTTLPDGTRYASQLEFPLKPMEHAVFTIPFSMDRRDDETITSTLSVTNDLNSSNNRSSYEVDYD